MPRRPLLLPNPRKKARAYYAAIRNESGGVPGSYDPDVQAWIDAIELAGGLLTSGEKDAVNAYWIRQKADGLDLEAIADYPFTGDAIAMEFNLKNPAAFRITFTNTVPGDFTANGWQPNGANSFADTGIVPSTDTLLNDLEVEYYSRTEIQSNNADVGARNADGQTLEIQLQRAPAPTDILFDCYNKTIGQGRIFEDGPGTSLGQFILGRLSNIDQKIYHNGLVSNSATGGGGLAPSFSLYLGARNDNGVAGSFSDRQCAGAGIYNGLTGAQAGNWAFNREVMNLRLSRAVNSSAAGATEYQNVIARLTTPSRTLTNALWWFINSQVISGNYALIDEIYLLASDTEANALTGLKGLKTATKVGIPTFTTLEGFAFPGSGSNYLDSNFNGSVDGNFALSNALHGAFIKSFVADSGSQSFVGVDETSNNRCLKLGAVDQWQFNLNRAGSTTFTEVGTEAIANLLFVVSRFTAGNTDGLFNGLVVEANTQNSQNVPNDTYFIGASNVAGTPTFPATATISLAVFGQGVGFDQVDFSDEVAAMLKRLNPIEF